MKADRWFLGASLLGAANTLNAYRPLARRGPAATLSFLAGWPTSEVPLPTLAWQAASSAAFVRAGALRTRTGRVALAVDLASWAALVRLSVEARSTAALVERALVEGLGPGYREELTDRAEDRPLTLAQITLPAVGERRRYRAARNVSYGEFGRRNRLDVWRPADLAPGSRAPVLLQVHGGGWMTGDKEVQGEVLLSEMARRGWVGVAITYRLSPRATWPDHVVDVKRAIAWARAHIAEHGGDPDFIAITGGSAGGHLTALAALTPGDPAYQPGFEDADTSVQAAVPFYGVYDVADLAGTGRREIADLWERFVLKARHADDPSLGEQASPITRVGPGAPPMFVLHGENDTLVPVDQARRFVARLRDVSRAPVAYAELPRAQHAFEVVRSVRALHAVRGVARFLDVVHTRHAANA